jgi:hypothetical protein
MPTLSPKTFDPKRGLLVVGTIPVEGYADGTYVNLTFPNNAYNVKEGADGELGRNRVANGLRADLEIVLLQTSITNDLLFALLTGAYDTNVTFPITYKDLNGTTVWSSNKCWPTKMPDMPLDKDNVANRSWTFVLPEVQGLIVGGNI